MILTSQRKNLGWLRHFAFVAGLGLALTQLGCGQTMVSFPLQSGDKPVEKFFTNSSKGPVIEALKKDDLLGAIKAQEEITKSADVMPMDFYRLAILYEARYDWDAALKALEDGVNLDKEKFKSKEPGPFFKDELAFVKKQKGE